MAPASIGHGDFGLTPRSVRVERSRGTHRARATVMGVPTSLDTNGPNRSHHAPTTSVGTEHARDPARRPATRRPQRRPAHAVARRHGAGGPRGGRGRGVGVAEADRAGAAPLLVRALPTRACRAPPSPGRPRAPPAPPAAAPKRADHSADRRMLLLAAMALVVGAGGAVGAWALLKLIALATNLFWFGRFSTAHAAITDASVGLAVVAIPVVGGLLIGLMARFGSDKIRGHGIPEAIEAILYGQSRLSPKVAILKPISSAISKIGRAHV